jgi:hypothetical protein
LTITSDPAIGGQFIDRKLRLREMRARDAGMPLAADGFSEDSRSVTIFHVLERFFMLYRNEERNSELRPGFHGIRAGERIFSVGYDFS